MCDVKERIKRYSEELYKREKTDIFDIPEERKIVLGDNIILDKIYLNNGDSHGIFGSISINDTSVNGTLCLEVLHDGLLNQIAHILRVELNNSN